MWNLANANLEVHRKLEEFHKTLDDKIKLSNDQVLKKAQEEKDKLLKKAEEEKKVAFKEGGAMRMEKTLKLQKGIGDYNEALARDKAKLTQDIGTLKTKHQAETDILHRRQMALDAALFETKQQYENEVVNRKLTEQEFNKLQNAYTELDMRFENESAAREESHQVIMGLARQRDELASKANRLSEEMFKQAGLMKGMTERNEALTRDVNTYQAKIRAYQILESDVESNTLQQSVPAPSHEFAMEDTNGFSNGDMEEIVVHPHEFAVEEDMNEFVDEPPEEISDLPLVPYEPMNTETRGANKRRRDDETLLLLENGPTAPVSEGDGPATKTRRGADGKASRVRGPDGKIIPRIPRKRDRDVRDVPPPSAPLLLENGPVSAGTVASEEEHNHKSTRFDYV